MRSCCARPWCRATTSARQRRCATSTASGTGSADTSTSLACGLGMSGSAATSGRSSCPSGTCGRVNDGRTHAHGESLGRPERCGHWAAERSVWAFWRWRCCGLQQRAPLVPLALQLRASQRAGAVPPWLPRSLLAGFFLLPSSLPRSQTPRPPARIPSLPSCPAPSLPPSLPTPHSPLPPPAATHPVPLALQLHVSQLARVVPPAHAAHGAHGPQHVRHQVPVLPKLAHNGNQDLVVLRSKKQGKERGRESNVTDFRRTARDLGTRPRTAGASGSMPPDLCVDEERGRRTHV